MTILVPIIVTTAELVELLKQPLRTLVSLSNCELDDYRFQDGTHILLSLKDFKVADTERS